MESPDEPEMEDEDGNKKRRRFQSAFRLPNQNRHDDQEPQRIHVRFNENFGWKVKNKAMILQDQQNQGQATPEANMMWRDDSPMESEEEFLPWYLENSFNLGQSSCDL